MFLHNPQHIDSIPLSAPAFVTRVPGRIVVNPRVTPQGIFVNTMGMKKPESWVFRLSLQDGKVRWRHQYPAFSMWEPVVSGNQVIVGLGSSYMYFYHGMLSCNSGHLHGWESVSDKTGKIVWKHLGLCQTMPTAALRNGNLYGVSANGRFEALSINTGKPIWRLHSRWTPAMSSPAFYGNLAVFSTARFVVGNVYNPHQSVVGINLKTHKVQWEYTLHTARNMGESSPVIYQGAVYATWYSPIHHSILGALLGDNEFQKNFYLVKLNLSTGKLLWRSTYAVHERTFYARVWNKWFRKTPPISDGPLVAYHNLIFSVPREMHTLYAISAKSGEVQWQYRLPYGSVGVPTICRGEVIESVSPFTLPLQQSVGVSPTKKTEYRAALVELSPKSGKLLGFAPGNWGRMGPGTPVCLKNGVLAWGAGKMGSTLEMIPFGKFRNLS